MSDVYDKPLPNLDEKTAAPFWLAAREGRLIAQVCPACDDIRWPPAAICPACLVPGGDWSELSGLGTIWSYAVYHRAFRDAFRGDLPYIVAVVELDDGPRVITNIVASPGDCRVGQRVAAVFDPVTPEVTLVKFAPTHVVQPL